MTASKLRSVAIIYATCVAAAAQGEPPAPQVVTLDPYEVWCAEVSIPDGADTTRYYALLAEGVKTIDRSLGTGASTGTPFAARARRQEESVSSAGQAPVAASIVTVCATVASPADPAATSMVHRETRSEVVFAQGCPIADRDGCAERLRMQLAQRVGIPPNDDRVKQLFWRAATSIDSPNGAAAFARALLAPDRRRVYVAPSVTTSGNPAAAADLSKPIDQQVQRPLLTARPSWYSVNAQPQDAWVVVAITLSPEMARQLIPGAATPSPPPQPSPAPSSQPPPGADDWREGGVMKAVASIAFD
jgi:hypothetical protein